MLRPAPTDEQLSHKLDQLPGTDHPALAQSEKRANPVTYRWYMTPQIA